MPFLTYACFCYFERSLGSWMFNGGWLGNVGCDRPVAGPPLPRQETPPQTAGGGLFYIYSILDFVLVTNLAEVVVSCPYISLARTGHHPLPLHCLLLPKFANLLWESLAQGWHQMRYVLLRYVLPQMSAPPEAARAGVLANPAWSRCVAAHTPHLGTLI